MSYYNITDGTTPHLVLDMEISESTNELDECAVLVDGKYTDNIALTISDNLSTPIFYGFQKSTEQDDKSFINYKLSVMEKAVEMQYIILTSGTATSFIKSDTATNLLNYAIGQVNTAYGYTGANTWTLDTTYFTDTATVYKIGCYYTNALAFIRKVAIDNLGLKLWFDSATKKVYLGQHFVDRTATPISYLTKVETRDSNKRGCTKVIVVGKNSNITGSAGSGNLIRVFEYLAATTATECNNLASILLADLQYTNVKYDLVLTTDIVCDVADYINVDGNNQVIIKKVTTFDQIKISTEGLVTTSVIETLGNSLTEISGETVSGTDASWSGEWQNIPVAGKSAEYTIDIKDVNLISNFLLSADVSAYRTDVTVGENTDYLSSVDVVSASADDTSYTLGYDMYFPSVNGVYCPILTDGYQHGLFSTYVETQVETASYLIYVIERSYDGTTWTSTGSSVGLYQTANTTYIRSISMMFGGSTTPETMDNPCRIRLHVYSNNGYRVKTVTSYGSSSIVTRSKRHTHPQMKTVQRTTDTSLPAATSLGCNINGVAHTFTMPLTATDITSHLITGKNTLNFYYIASGYGAIKPYASYQTLGKS